jgi:lipopolysaccharide biosynthesis regulator YciM/DNA-binding MarR family transcriptional regulator
MDADSLYIRRDMKNEFNSRVSIFTPSASDINIIKKVFTGRDEERDRILGVVDDVIGHPEKLAVPTERPWVLIRGPRGFGKTNLVTVLHDLIKNNTEYADKIRVAWLPEDAAGYATWNDWLDKIGARLAENYKDTPEFIYVKGFLDGTVRKESGKKRTAAMEEAVRLFLGKRMLFLIQENIEKLLEGLGKDAEQMLVFLDSVSCFFLGATSAIEYNPELTENRWITTTLRMNSKAHILLDTPFGERFAGNVIELDEFSIAEAQEYLGKVATLRGDEKLIAYLNSSEGIARLKTINRLAGGAPRIWAIFADFMTSNDVEVTLLEWDRLADQLTTYYQERMWILPPRQQQITRYLAESLGALELKEIANLVDLSSDLARSNILQLIEKGYVKEVKNVRGFYDLREPLFRLYTQTKDSHGEPIKLIVEFLFQWFNKNELLERLTQVPEDSHRTRRTLEGAFGLYLGRYPNTLMTEETRSLWSKLVQYVAKLVKGDFAESESEGISWTQARVDFAQMLEDDPKSPYVLYYLTILLLQGGEWEEGKQRLGETFEEDKTNDTKSQLFSKLATALANANEFDRAESVARGIDVSRRSEALVDLVSSLANVGHIDRAKSVAHDIEDVYFRAIALIKLVAPMVDAGYRDKAEKIADEAESLARAIVRIYSRSSALSELVSPLAKAGFKDKAEKIADEAESVARGIINNDSRSIILSELVSTLAKAGMFDRAESIVRDIEDANNWRSIALMNLASTLAKAGMFDRAESIVRDIEDTFCHILALGELVSPLAKAGYRDKAEKIANEAESVARRIAESTLSKRGRLHFSYSTFDRDVFDLPEIIVRSNLDVEMSNRALSRLVTPLANAGMFDRAEYIAQRMEDIDLRSNAFSDLVVPLANAGKFNHAESIARSIENAFYRSLALSGLIAPLANAGFKEKAENIASELVQSIRDMHSYYDKHQYLLNATPLCLALLSNTANTLLWKEQAQTFVTLYEKDNILSSLGQGITSTIPALFTLRPETNTETLSDMLANQWNDAWQEAGKDKRDLTIALRLLGAAVKWREKPDPRILVRLPLEERELLAEMLPTTWRGYTRE